LEAAAYRRLLLRLVAIPMAAVALLAGLMVYGVHEVQQSARQVDRSDRIIAQANHLIKLMIDQETGFRGFLLTRDPQFLQPYREAEQQIQPQFAALFQLIQNSPQQTARLKTLQVQSEAWRQTAQASISQPALGAAPSLMMVRRKQEMDVLRESADDFLSAEAAIRAGRSSVALRIGDLSLTLLLGSSAVIGLLLAWIIYRHVRQLTRAYSRQLSEVRRRGEESYAREQWLNTTLRSIGDAVIACDPQGNVVFMNRVAEQLTGWHEKDSHGQPLSTIFPIFNQHTRAVVENPVDKVRRLGTVVGLANHTILVSRDQKEFHIDDSAAPIMGADARVIGIVLVFRDITERYAAERALVRTEKLASAGRLAAAIAHEVNNPLEGLVNLVYLARRGDDLATIREHLAQADGELQRIAHITRQSLGFYRESLSPGLFRPDLVTREVFDFFAFRATNARVKLQVTVNTEQNAFGNAGELRQVISNLLANSLDACKAGDAICVRVSAARSARQVAGVRIVVADTGCGINQKNLKAVFEPFFTTKKDTGTGLGLWVSRELIEKQGGRLTVRSRDRGERTGTVFTIFLPTAAAYSAEATNGKKLSLESSTAQT
jgi:PAS domain S-box-containing protein